jgi:Sulfatase
MLLPRIPRFVLYMLLITIPLNADRILRGNQNEEINENEQATSTNTDTKRVLKTPTSARIPPNVVVFLVDDMGWNQVGYHAKPSGNDEIKTPNIDHYATKVGIELDRGYMTPWCGPSRAALITGRTNVYNFNVSSLISTFDDNIGYVAGVKPGTKTLATALKEYGKSINIPYTTWFNGKFGIGVSVSAKQQEFSLLK